VPSKPAREPTAAPGVREGEGDSGEGAGPVQAGAGDVEAERGQSIIEAECVRVQELVCLLEYGAEMHYILLTP
jgi:hypothetical protein